MRLLDAQVLNGALLLTIDGSPIEMLGAKAAVSKVLSCEVYLATPGMMSGVQTASRKPGESNLQFLARLAHHRYDPRKGSSTGAGARRRAPSGRPDRKAGLPWNARSASADLLDAGRHVRQRDRAQPLPIRVEGRYRNGLATGLPFAGARSTMDWRMTATWLAATEPPRRGCCTSATPSYAIGTPIARRQCRNRSSDRNVAKNGGS